MAKKKKASTQPEQEQTLFTEEQTTTPEVNDGEEANNIQKTSKDRLSALEAKRAEIINELGGEEAAKNRLELTKAFITYRKRGTNIQEITDSVLQEYRKQVGKLGYKGIKEEMIPIVEYYGTIKDKAALCTAYFDCDSHKGDKIRNLTRTTVDRIRKGLRSDGREAMVEYMNEITKYDAMRKARSLFYEAKYRYLTCALTTASYFGIYEWLGVAENFFNSVSPLIAQDKEAEFKDIARKYNEYLESYQRFGELDEVSGKGWIDKQRNNAYEFASVGTDIAENNLSNYKGMIEGFKIWIKQNSAEMFIPFDIRRDIIEVEYDTCIREIQSKYYFAHLEDMSQSGQTPTEEDRKIAIFPIWDEVGVNEVTRNFITRKLDGFKQTF